MRVVVGMALIGLAAACGRGPTTDVGRAVAECRDLGYEPGTSDLVRCAQKVVNQDRAGRDEKLDRHLARRR